MAAETPTIVPVVTTAIPVSHPNPDENCSAVLKDVPHLNIRQGEVKQEKNESYSATNDEKFNQLLDPSSFVFLQEEEFLKSLDEGFQSLWKETYRQRLKHVNRGMVDGILQSDIVEMPESSECPLEYQMLVLANLQRILGLLLLSIPQSLEEIEEATEDSQLLEYFFRPYTDKSVFEIPMCRGCYLRDHMGKCREMVSCKGGSGPGVSPRRLTPQQLQIAIRRRSG